MLIYSKKGCFLLKKKKIICTIIGYSLNGKKNLNNLKYDPYVRTTKKFGKSEFEFINYLRKMDIRCIQSSFYSFLLQ